jgi:hypothetical protein
MEVFIMKKVIISIVGTACVACAIGAALITNVTNEYEQKLEEIVATYEQNMCDINSRWEDRWEDVYAEYMDDEYAMEEELPKFINGDDFEIEFVHDSTTYVLGYDKKNNKLYNKHVE